MQHVDLHNHTEFSFDSTMKIEDAIVEAKKHNLIFGIAEHYDSNDLRDDRDMSFDIPEYFKQYTKYRENGDVLLGIELGLDCRNEFVNLSKKVALSYPFDVVIGSAHKIYGLSLGPFIDKYQMNKIEYHTTYLNEVVQLLQANPYIDTFAHIDYPVRYTNFEINEAYYEEFETQYNAVFDKLIELDIALEINTSRFSNQKMYNALFSVVNGYIKRGGKYVTIGGDAHIAKNVGVRYYLGRELADAANAQVVYFRNRERILD